MTHAGRRKPGSERSASRCTTTHQRSPPAARSASTSTSKCWRWPSIGSALTGLLSPDRGTALVTEGLLSYFDRPTVEGMWTRFASFLGDFPAGLYLSDMHLADWVHARLVPQLFLRLLSVFAAGRVHLHFDNPPELLGSCRETGFARAALHCPATFAAELSLPRTRGADHTRVLEAWTREPLPPT